MHYKNEHIDANSAICTHLNWEETKHIEWLILHIHDVIAICTNLPRLENSLFLIVGLILPNNLRLECDFKMFFDRLNYLLLRLVPAIHNNCVQAPGLVGLNVSFVINNPIILHPFFFKAV